MTTQVRNFIPALSPRKLDVLYYIRRAHTGTAKGREGDSHRVTLDALAAHFAYSLRGTTRHLEGLRFAGYITFVDGQFNETYELKIVRGGL